MKYHNVFVNFEKKNRTCRLLHIIGGALWVNINIMEDLTSIYFNVCIIIFIIILIKFIK